METRGKDMKSLGCLHLIPVPISDHNHDNSISIGLSSAVNHILDWIVETPKTARAQLKIIAPKTPVSEQRLYSLNKHNPQENIKEILKPCINGLDMGLISDAGAPGVADPGSIVVKKAHQLGITVKPWAGPSSIFLGLMASGFNGQNFTFNGYISIKKPERKNDLLKLERDIRNGITQIFIETPYRNMQTIKDLCSTLSNDIDLCVASNLNGKNELILRKSISDWRKFNNFEIFHKVPIIFILGRSND